MKTDSANRTLWRTPGGAITILTTIGVIGYTVWIFSASNTPHVDAILARSGMSLLNLLLAILGAVVVAQPAYGRALRAAWLLLGLGALSRALASGLLTYYQIPLDPIFPEFPALVDILQIIYYPFTLTGLLLFPFVFVPPNERTVLWLDLAIIIAFSGMIVWFYLIGIPQEAPDFSLGQAWLLAHPVGDLLILAGTIALSQRDLSRAARTILSFLTLAMAIAAAADLFFAYYELNTYPYEMRYLCVLWLSASQAAVFAAARQVASGPDILNDPPARFSPMRHLLRLALPYLAVTLGLIFLLAALYPLLSLNSRLLGLLYGACALVVFVLLRQFLVLRENLRLYQRMRLVAWTDSLTGVYNRHFFNEMLPREMERAQRYDNNLSLMILDIDGFKKYNDTYGHLQGDAVLRSIARVFVSQVRSADTLARYGGDEFVIILPETNRRRARLIAERIQQAVLTQNELDVKLSVSVGITVFRSGLTPEQFIDEADKDLYKQKHKRAKEINPTSGKAEIATPGGSHL